MSELDPATPLPEGAWPRPREEVRERLLAQAHLFEDPGAYRSGVLDAFAVLTETDGR